MATDARFVEVGTASGIESLRAPPGLPLVGHLLDLDRERIHVTLEAWARTHGPYYRLRVATKHVLVVSDPAGIRHVLRERPHAFRRLQTIESVMREMGIIGVISAEGERWKQQRRMFMVAFNPAHLRAYFAFVVRATGRLLERWRAAACEGREVDVKSDLQRYTTDVTAGLAFGADVNTLDGAHEAVRHLDQVLPMIHRRVNAVVPYWRLVKLPADRAFDRALTRLHGAIEAFIALARARLAADPRLRDNPANLLDALVAVRDSPSSDFTDDDVFGNVFSALLAGGDATANAIAWVIYYLCEHPEWQVVLREEVARVLGDAPLLADYGRLGEALPHVDAFVQETMRVKPAFPILLHEANHATRLGPIAVSTGVPIALLMRAGGFDAAAFRDPERFDPTRWLGTPGHWLLPFGSGPRMCPGHLLAKEELRMVVTMLVRNFSVELAASAPVAECLKFTLGPNNLRASLKPVRA
jgi:cytochrome P450